MSVSFVSAFTGEDASTISLKEHSWIDGTESMRSLLRKRASLFGYIIGTEEIDASYSVVNDMVDDHMTVNFMKPAVTFNFYFHDAPAAGLRSDFLAAVSGHILLA